jgi:hypothetical protein
MPWLLYSQGQSLIHWTGGWVGFRDNLDVSGEERNLSSLPRIEPQLTAHPAHRLVTIPTKLLQLVLV